MLEDRTTAASFPPSWPGAETQGYAVVALENTGQGPDDRII
ncbi:DEDDh family exonuclease, partial [Streptomyces sp. NPDC059766]